MSAKGGYWSLPDGVPLWKTSGVAPSGPDTITSRERPSGSRNAKEERSMARSLRQRRRQGGPRQRDRPVALAGLRVPVLGEAGGERGAAGHRADRGDVLVAAPAGGRERDQVVELHPGGAAPVEPRPVQGVLARHVGEAVLGAEPGRVGELAERALRLGDVRRDQRDEQAADGGHVQPG